MSELQRHLHESTDLLAAELAGMLTKDRWYTARVLLDQLKEVIDAEFTEEGAELK